MLTPPFLKPNDTLEIVAPAGKIDQNTVMKAASVIESWGVHVRLADHLFDNHFGFSANDNNRLLDMQQALDDRNIKAILCARGGYGTNRIIDKLNFAHFSKNPKWVIGFSDITLLHAHIQANFGIETIHGSMCNGLANQQQSPEDAATLKTILFGEKPKYEMVPSKRSKKGQAKGVLTGGNLSILLSLLGTPSETDTAGKILFIEEIGEYHYRIDRMIMQLKRAGKLKNLAGLIVGGFDDLPDSAAAFGMPVDEIIMDAVKAYHYPVLLGFRAGHGTENKSLILGREISLTVDETALVEF